MRTRRKLEVITNSRLKSFRRCRRLHHLRYERGILPVEDRVELRFGQLIHRALEAWWIERVTDNDQRADLLRRFHAASPEVNDIVWGSVERHPMNAALDVLDEEDDLFLRAKARAMIIGYGERWHDALGSHDDWEVLGVEDEFYAPLVNPATGEASRLWQLGGKRDILVRDRMTGEVLIVDHKTSSEDLSPGSRYWRRLVMDTQISLYYAGAKAQGYDPTGFVHDVLRKPQIRPQLATPEDQRRYTKEKKDKWGTVTEPSRLYAADRDRDEMPDEYEARCLAAMRENPEAWFVRETVPRLDGELAEFDADLWADAKLMRESEISGRNPRNPDGCEMYGSLCGFFDVCCGQGSLDDRAKFTTIDQPHVELEHVPEEEATP